MLHLGLDSESAPPYLFIPLNAQTISPRRYRQLSLDDLWHAVWQKRAVRTSTITGLSLMQHQQYLPAQEVFFRALMDYTSAAVSAAPAGAGEDFAL